MNPRRTTRGLIVAVSVIGAGLIHLAAIRSHLGSPAAVASFTGIGMVQILLGASLLHPGGTRQKRLAVVGLGVLTIGAWFISRTWGLPALSGHEGREAVGAADLAAVALQLASILLVVVPVRASGTPSGRIAGALMVLPVAAVSAIASVSLLSVPPHAHEPDSPPSAQRAVYINGPLVKRLVPVAATPPSTVSDHAEAPGAPAHSH